MDADNNNSAGDAGADGVRPESLRGEPRDSMLLMASLRRAGGSDIAIKIRNLSSGGLMAEAPTGLLKDEAVEVDLRGIGIVAGRVAWVAGTRIGLCFAHAIDHKKARKPVSGGAQPILLMRASRDSRRPGVRSEY